MCKLIYRIITCFSRCGRDLVLVLVSAALCGGLLAGCSSSGASGEAPEISESAGETTAESDGGDAAQEAADSVSRESYYFDTICSITVYGMDREAFLASGLWDEEESELTFEDAATAAISDVFSLCNEYENLLSKTREGTDIWNVNRAEGEAVACDDRTVSLVLMGIAYGELSGGAFDITVGIAADLWDFTSGDENASLPDDRELAAAVEHVDYTAIEVDEGAGTIRLTDPEAEIDLGGIAKGYIADAVCERLRAVGVTSAIVSLGGNIECVGGKPASFGFQEEDSEITFFSIGIETPYSGYTDVVGYSKITDATMVTSGVYERYFTLDGKEYHHILDTETGYPVETDVLGVTILGEEGTSGDCDALATICLILGSEEGLDLIRSLDGYEAAFILEDGSILLTDGMDFTEM